MARCKYCDKSGFFMKVTERSLCPPCDVVFVHQLLEAGRLAQESMNIALSSKNIETKISRLIFTQNTLSRILPYERKGIPTYTPLPSEAIRAARVLIMDALRTWYTDQLDAARVRFENGKTLSARTSPLIRLMEKLVSMKQYQEIVGTLDQLEQSTRKLVDKVASAFYSSEGGRYAFKGNKKKAIDCYLEALHSIQNDSIPDNLQAQEIRDIETKILELGGTVPKRSEVQANEHPNLPALPDGR
jgi:hypothetical protein